ncbi:MAG: GNAT family N-acetyltransferase [Candidatus Lokiarchaeota archaeon]|nr:GNAT family N-acetyltransferase [Candidatus Lokiarchaeota archaeon]
MRMVKCEEKYWPFVLKLRNKFKKSFFSQSTITNEEHEKFMRKWSDSYFICIADDERTLLGWVGVVNGDIRIAVPCQFQNQGIGKFMLEYIKVTFPEATAQIFSSNQASINAFNSVGIKNEIV